MVAAAGETIPATTNPVPAEMAAAADDSIRATTHTRHRVIVEGAVYDEDSGDSLPHVTIQALGTGTATKANADGKYRLVMPRGDYDIKVSHVGYYSTQFHIAAADTLVVHDVRLKSSIIDLGTRRVFTRAYDPAQRIIAEAIARKKDILSQIHDYSFDAYSRLVLENADKPDSENIILITETRSTSYWEQPDKYKEVITARTQSANLHAESNLVGAGEMLNFNRNRIEIGEYEIVSPTARDAMDFYNYYLLDTIYIDTRPVFVLEVEPKNEYSPLFVGQIQIVDSTFDVVGVDVGFSKGVHFPMVDSARYYQSMAQFQDKYWMPIEIGLSGRVAFDVPFPGIPKRMDFSHVASISDYRIDAGLKPGTFNDYDMVVDKDADNVDSTAWQTLRLIPLTAMETRGYERIDSIEHAPKPFYKYALRGMAAAALLVTVGQADLFHFSRVEGPYAGIGLRPDNWIPKARLRMKTGYAFDDKAWQYEFGGTYEFWHKARFRAGAFIKDEIVHRPTIMSGENYNPTFHALLFKVDPFDYYRERGFSVVSSIKPVNHTGLSIRYDDFRQSSKSKTTDYGFFRKSITPRDNPPIIDGTMRTLSLTLQYDSRNLIDNKGRDLMVDALRYIVLESGIEYASPKFIANDFDFRRYYLRMRIRTQIGRLGTTRLTGYIGSSDGELPAQRYFIVDFKVPEFFSASGFHTLHENNFAGDRAAMVYASHDFGPYIFRSTGDMYLKKIPFGLIIFGGAMWTEFSRPSSIHDVSVLSAPTAYTEIGFGITDLTPFLMPFNLAMDFAWQLSDYRTRRFIWSFGFNL
jgi:hypothetical protein